LIFYVSQDDLSYAKQGLIALQKSIALRAAKEGEANNQPSVFLIAAR
jgi:hypothetical protein